ncbi:hypothetical protein R1flu_007637 [Riccia fluitans]|uniref:Actin-related protein 5 n=1 Tax=Riccia fluitans TaxID=41844 RepID=A0ABD1Z098_9MARC
MAETSIRPRRQRDYHLIPRQHPLVIDNGAFRCRMGWAGEDTPRVEFRNVVNKPRHRASGETVNVIGDFDPSLVKTFDFTRAAVRTPFDGNVVYQYETMESILDYGFERMGIEGDNQIDHPVLMTECPCNPAYCRGKMAELLFEAYDIPAVAFGIDGVFSYLNNRNQGVSEADGLVVCSGHMATHVIPMISGEPVMEAAVRTPVGGYHVTDYLKRLLSLEYPYHVNSISWEKVEELKQEHCYIAGNYHSELEIFQNDGPEAEEKTRWWQLPWVPSPPEKEPATEEEIARKAAVKEKQGQRLREMAAAKRSSKIADLENEVVGLEQLLLNLDADDEYSDALLAESGYLSREEIQSALTKASVSLKKLKGEAVQPEPEKVDETPDKEKYPLLDVPNSLLTAEQLKEKKRQRFLKMTSEGRARAKLKRQEEGLEREREKQLDEERRLANPEQYLEELRTRYGELAARAEGRKRKKQKNGSGASAGGQPATGTLVLGGRGERLSASQKERMRLLTTAAFDRGKEEDTFGTRDEDWQLYKRMSRDGDDDEDAEEDDAELARLEARLQEIDSTFQPTLGLVPGAQKTSVEVQAPKPLTAEDFRISLGVERFRCPEIVMQPTMVGVDQVGIGEMVEASLRRLPENLHQLVVKGTILLTGGNALFSGLNERLATELRACRPFGSTIRVVKAANPLLDAWRGASRYADSSALRKFSFTKEDYEEKGQDWLRKHKLIYSHANTFS